MVGSVAAGGGVRVGAAGGGAAIRGAGIARGCGSSTPDGVRDSQSRISDGVTVNRDCGGTSGGGSGSTSGLPAARVARPRVTIAAMAAAAQMRDRSSRTCGSNS